MADAAPSAAGFFSGTVFAGIRRHATMSRIPATTQAATQAQYRTVTPLRIPATKSPSATRISSPAAKITLRL